MRPAFPTPTARQLILGKTLDVPVPGLLETVNFHFQLSARCCIYLHWIDLRRNRYLKASVNEKAAPDKFYLVHSYVYKRL
jgi:hypothetical protein